LSPEPEPHHVEESPRPEPRPTAERQLSEKLMQELVRLRKQRKISQEPVAKALGLTQSAVSYIENLKAGASLEAALLYARAIGVEIVVVKPTRRKKGSSPDQSIAN
jgi:transcriptional regulator with XRE-family HTH domain